MQSRGFNEDIVTILAEPPSSCQRIILARASMSPEIWQLTKNHLRCPIAVDLVGDSTRMVAASVKCFSVKADTGQEAAVIADLIRVRTRLRFFIVSPL